MRGTLCALFLLFFVSSFAQQAITDSTERKNRSFQEDSVAAFLARQPVKKRKKFMNDGARHSATKAVLLSLALPGLGQAYNKKYWKIPIVYGALGGLGYLIGRNAREFRNYQAAFIMQADDDPMTQGSYKGITDRNVLDRLKTSNRRSLEFSILGFTVLYGLQLIDAAVDAHLYNFNVTEDISMQIEPTFNWIRKTTSSSG
jgi:hypothetical protein